MKYENYFSKLKENDQSKKKPSNFIKYREDMAKSTLSNEEEYLDNPFDFNKLVLPYSGKETRWVKIF